MHAPCTRPCTRYVTRHAARCSRRYTYLSWQVLEAARQAESVLYLSCNPHTLARDLAALGTTHRVSDAALFDQFPHTPHAAVGVMLQRRRLATRPRLTRGTETDGDGGRWQGTL